MRDAPVVASAKALSSSGDVLESVGPWPDSPESTPSLYPNPPTNKELDEESYDADGAEIAAAAEYMAEPVSNSDVPDLAAHSDLDIKNPYIQAQFDALGSQDKMKLMHAVAQVESEKSEKSAQEQQSQPSTTSVQQNPPSIIINTPTVQMTQDTLGILKIPTPDETEGDNDDKGEDGDASEDSSSAKKVISFSDK